MANSFLIVEDHPLYADALRRTLCGAFVDPLVKHAGSLGEAKAAIRSEEPFELALLDLWLPDTRGVDGLIELRKSFPHLPVAVVSAFSEASLVDKAMRSGAAGFIPKSSRQDAMVRGIKNILAGEIEVPDAETLVDSAAPEVEPAIRKRLSTLTQMQLRVLQKVCQGLLNKQIAHQLRISETTVKAHLTLILRKLGVSTRTQAVLEVTKLGSQAMAAFNDVTSTKDCQCTKSTARTP